ncbi:hypothetical protein WAE56_07925 [Iodobacter sp. LRB]|uniref:hypothetical protein n=1 Tax=unclassified Iodobacter TaxID=235634 RepID=UPI000C0C6E33|nr:hypothetical protein [Iodobacter sp. BJB302]PHV01870.1 hypothetical protein CSQ88_09645 [Iodobacter sp. BJB302]
MAKHLKQTDVDAIVDIIRGWLADKLTWDEVCEASAKVIGKTPTRQTLNAHTAIKDAYSAKKSGLKIHGPRTAMPSSLAVAAQRIARLQTENDELKMKNDMLLEQFVKWQYNAYKHGLKEHQLNAELPRIDRERTEDAK